jgi:large subunit ribosomal protein L6
MSRIGKKPVLVPDGVRVTISGCNIAVEGALGKLDWTCRPEIQVRYDEAARQVTCARQTDDRQSRALHGLTRALVQNMVTGVSQGYEKRLEVVGVGYLAAVDGTTLQLRVGFATEVHRAIPAGLTVTCPDQNHILIKGIDKQQVGEFAAEVRAVRKPEPYKGKGIRYEGEQIRRKAGKTAT